jgi:hypothetical protein
MTADQQDVAKDQLHVYDGHEYIISDSNKKATHRHEERIHFQTSIGGKAIKPVLRGSDRRPNTSNVSLSVQWAAQPELVREARGLLLQLQAGIPLEDGLVDNRSKSANAGGSKNRSFTVNAGLLGAARALRLLAQRDAGRRAIAQVPGAHECLLGIMQACLDGETAADHRCSLQVSTL